MKEFLKFFTTRPEIGVKPKYIWQGERFDDICKSIERRMLAGQKIPLEWISEYNELLVYVK